jgi:hypothetical protein
MEMMEHLLPECPGLENNTTNTTIDSRADNWENDMRAEEVTE